MNSLNYIDIPESWTYLAHRSNLGRWEYNRMEANSILVTKLMSAVTEQDIYRDKEHFPNQRVLGYSLGSDKPFEIRCIIPDRNNINTISDPDVKKNVYYNFYYDRHNIGGAGGQRHPSIPKNEELIVLGNGYFDEIYQREFNIIWTVPKSLYAFYMEEVSKGNNREMDTVLKQYDMSNSEDIKKNRNVYLAGDSHVIVVDKREDGYEIRVGKKDKYGEWDYLNKNNPFQENPIKAETPNDVETTYLRLAKQISKNEREQEHNTQDYKR